MEADGLPEPLPLVTPPLEDDMAEAANAEPPVAEIVSPPATPHRTTFASLTGDKARALSKPERDAFDKIAEALARCLLARGSSPSRRIGPSLRKYPSSAVRRRQWQDTGPTVDIAFLDKLPVALAILRGGDIIHANRAFLDLCGYPDVATIDSDGGFAQVFEGAALSRDAAIPAIRRRDGVEIPVSARLHSMPMEGGIASLLVVQEDSRRDKPRPACHCRTAVRGYGGHPRHGHGWCAGARPQGAGHWSQQIGRSSIRQRAVAHDRHGLHRSAGAGKPPLRSGTILTA